MLKPDQIKQFNARAEAGERAVMEWWERHREDSHVYLFRIVGLGDHARIFSSRIGVELYYGKSGAFGPDGKVFLAYRCKFRSLPAAQLAAEHLLREATAPLWQEAIDRLIRAAMAAQREEGKPG